MRTHDAWQRFATFSGWNCHLCHGDCIVLSAWHDESLRSLLLSAWSRMCLFPILAPGDPSGNTYVGPEDCLNWPTMLEHTDKTAALAGANASACPQTVWGHMFCPHEGNILEMIPVKLHCCLSQQAPLSWYTRFTLIRVFAFILEVSFMDRADSLKLLLIFTAGKNWKSKMELFCSDVSVGFSLRSHLYYISRVFPKVLMWKVESFFHVLYNICLWQSLQKWNM